MSRRDLQKTLRVAPGVYLLLQIRKTDMLAELYADGLHDRAPVMFACSAIEDVCELFPVDDGTGLVIGSLHVVMPEAEAAALQEWVIERMPALEVA
ncbi:hypothetical protein XAP3CFBP6996_005575 [Xanthomonas citri pv. fuscans CFBP 6996]|uniref:hypothetical protein n=1 Tax=Xanthomonas citri TaxID=346 RepID=UPI000C1A6CE6|nr:hypothetical protein [Xanthomonas citri]ATS56522.1 hypothetical protein XcfCFBP6994P_16365 [Xanthomonas citri pv. phaseoli var. fuscans]ATS59470.1 hypothetical protein XcfCFBP6996P_09365 [Xanthomonas citri pv. phaseoli var. fuscans]PTY31459.1 hypothetical protein XAP3CFBP6996_005575 [Xanthomonas citri pv. fuscans CFBP 6996]QWN15395.1 hypothetical protein DGN02_05595 [Xanthomonas citri]SOO33344.1 conserved hypothetical protein [Xanthomonas citri pv. fuscans]